MNILLICPKFFDYDKIICRAIMKRGYIVDHLTDRPYDYDIVKAAYRYGRGTLLPLADHFYKEEVAAFGRTEYHKILVIKGEGVSSKLLRMLRRWFPKAELIYYTWDNLKNKPAYILENAKHYDRVLSFDHKDSCKYGFVYRPLFYDERNHVGVEEVNGSCDRGIDLSFVGTVHSDRVKIVKQLKGKLSSRGLLFFTYFYVQARWVFYTRKLFNPYMWGDSLSEYHTVPLRQCAVRTIFNNSRAILDIEHPHQTGLTMRSIEAIGAKRKIVTTNTAVYELDIYNSDNIIVISRSNPEAIDADFFNSPYVPLPGHVMKRYNLDTWVDDVVFSGR